MNRTIMRTALVLALVSPWLPAQTKFSAFRPGEMPAGWQEVKITDLKRPTRYELTGDAGVTVLHAVAQNAATGLGQPLQRTLKPGTSLAWRWKIAGLVPGADNAVVAREDAPARVLLEFAGDKARLPWTERAVDLVATAASGRELPYSTLMYIWSAELPVGTVVPNPRTRRVQMIVASTGNAQVGQWVSVERDLYADYQRAFGEVPGPLLSLGVMTDTDNTGQSAEAWYGDLVLAGR